MHHHKTASAALATFAELTTDLLSRGYRPGTPGHVSALALSADREAVASMICPGCGKKGMALHPYHRRDRYTALAACRACKACENY